MRLYLRKCQVLFAPAKNYTVANKNNISKRKKLKKSKLIFVINDLKKNDHKGRSIFQFFQNMLKWVSKDAS